jgi:hypothetical protein
VWNGTESKRTDPAYPVPGASISQSEVKWYQPRPKIQRKDGAEDTESLFSSSVRM